MQFEHLVFDLLVQRGLQNATWRTPGSDGGRDIQGEFSQRDFSGRTRNDIWYIECKRYNRAIDWPTVSAKLSYAANHQATFLLFCTTASLSPRCKDEVERHNLRQAAPAIRYWDCADLEILLAAEQSLLVKYSLVANKSDSAKRTKLLALAAKAAQAALGDVQAMGTAPASVELAASLAELGAVDEQLGGDLRPRTLQPTNDLYPWSRWNGPSNKLVANAHVLRATLAAVRLASRAASVDVSVAPDGTLSLDAHRRSVPGWVRSRVLDALLRQISLVGNVEFKFEKEMLLMSVRPRR